MQKIDTYIKSFLEDLAYPPLLNMLKNLKSGKKLRSRLLLSIAPKNEESLRLCAIVELIHLASLLHDDIIDESDLRRGAKSINAEFGAKNALMLGDILYAKAFFELSKQDKAIAQILSQAVSKLAIGELMDVHLSEEFNSNEDSYMQMIYHKTAVLIEAVAQCGALLARLDEKAFGDYGKHLGLAFQMVDDLLDIKSDEKTLGKPAMSDFKEGKTTLPYIYLYKSLDKNEQEKLKKLFRKTLNHEEEAWLKECFIKYEILQKASTQIQKHAQLALASIENYRNEELERLIHALLEREF